MIKLSYLGRVCSQLAKDERETHETWLTNGIGSKTTAEREDEAERT
jgi:hypothetical protein